MLLHKDKRTTSNNNPKTLKNIKPYSIMSLGSISQPHKNTNNRNRQTSHPNNHSKSSSTFFKNQNQTIQIPKNTNQNIEPKGLSMSHSTNAMYLPAFDDEIIQESSIFRFQNITNKVGITSCQKILCNSNFMGWEDNEEDNFQSSQIRIFVDMKKKIKKLSKTKKDNTKHHQIQEQTERHIHSHPFPLTSRIYSDSEVIVEGSIFRNKLISQRIDNDIDTDDEQIASGIRRLHRSLTEAVEEQRSMETN